MKNLVLIYTNLLSNAVTHPFLLNPCLDYEKQNEENDDNGDDQDDIFYEEPDLSEGVEWVDYSIVYGAEDEPEQ
jgi:hypothetical protein